ncbi:NCS2 family permease [Demetria terragena]|uniref:NCS2 family permease n=1 Tax=Demetria terragena TaxID=63959 RepID=UPI0003684DFA|nr:NCS2 family permease [Demetria terragena]
MGNPETRTQASALDRYFHISARGSSVAQEVRGGLVTFFAMAYIVVLNPLIIGTVKDGTGEFLGGGNAPNLAMVAAATALIAGVMTILMGLVANFPMALATGLGLNAFVAYGIAAQPNVTWADAMGLVVLEGIIILLLVLTGIRKAVLRAIPAALRTAITIGIGLFLTFIALYDAGIVRQAPAVPVELGAGGELTGWPTLVFVLGLFTIAVLMARKVGGAILYGIVGATVLALIVEAVGHVGGRTDATGKVVNPGGWSLTIPKLPEQVVDLPDLGLLGNFSLLGSFESLGAVAVILTIFTLLLADFFDTMGTMVAVGSEGDLLDEDGLPEGSQKILVVDSVAAIAGGAGGVSSNTSYIESAAGVGDGARTGLASIVTGGLFLLSMFFAPLVSMVPHEAATPALVIVGYLMMTNATDIDWKDIEVALPAFLTMVLMPFSYSISAGIGAGFISYVLLKVVRGKSSQVHPLLWAVSGLFVLYFAVDPIKTLFGVS